MNVAGIRYCGGAESGGGGVVGMWWCAWPAVLWWRARRCDKDGGGWFSGVFVDLRRMYVGECPLGSGRRG